MADDTQVSDNPIIAADDIDGVKYQRTKVVWGEDGTVNDASDANPLPVTDAATISASAYLDAIAAHSASPYGMDVVINDFEGNALSLALPLPASVSPVMDAATYSAGQSLQDAAFSISGATTANGRTTHLLGLRIIDKDHQGIDLVIDFFRSPPTTIPAAQAAYTLDDTDSAKVCGFIDTSIHGTWRDLGGSYIWQMTRSPVPLVSDTTVLYLLCSTKGAPTYSASGLIIEPTLARD